MLTADKCWLAVRRELYHVVVYVGDEPRAWPIVLTARQARRLARLLDHVANDAGQE